MVTTRAALAAIYQSSHGFVVDRVMGEWRQTAYTVYSESQWNNRRGPGMGMTA